MKFNVLALDYDGTVASHGTPARSLKKFVNLLARVPVSSIEEHVRHADFSRWVTKVLGDQTLASAIAVVEEQFQQGKVALLPEAIIQSIHDRYNLPGS